MYYFIFMLILSSCGNYKLANTGPIEHVYSMDGVKKIQKDITNEADPRALLQTQYTLNSDNRLLIRFENLSTYFSKVSTVNDHKFQVQLTPTSSDQIEAAQTRLKICPLNRQWMMRATWGKAHPFGTSGNWEKAGGDYDEVGCVKGTIPENTSAVKVLLFDMTQWFLDYPKGRNINFGLIIIATDTIEIYGDNSGTYSPRIKFLE